MVVTPQNRLNTILLETADWFCELPAPHRIGFLAVRIVRSVRQGLRCASGLPIGAEQYAYGSKSWSHPGRFLKLRPREQISQVRLKQIRL